MFVVVFLVAAVVGGALSLPSDWVRRRFSGPLRALGELAGVIVLIGIALAFASSGLLGDVFGMLGLIAGLAAGAVLADGLATRLWGRPGMRS